MRQTALHLTLLHLAPLQHHLVVTRHTDLIETVPVVAGDGPLRLGEQIEDHRPGQALGARSDRVEGRSQIAHARLALRARLLRLLVLLVQVVAAGADQELAFDRVVEDADYELEAVVTADLGTEVAHFVFAALEGERSGGTLGRA